LYLRVGKNWGGEAPIGDETRENDVTLKTKGLRYLEGGKMDWCGVGSYSFIKKLSVRRSRGRKSTCPDQEHLASREKRRH